MTDVDKLYLNMNTNINMRKFIYCIILNESKFYS